MTLFDERERAFENLFAHEEELRFLAVARRNELFARWAAEQIGLRGTEYRDYVRSFVETAVQPQSDRDLMDRVRADLLAYGHRTLRQRRTLDPFDDLVDDLAAIEHRNRQQIEDSEADAND